MDRASCFQLGYITRKHGLRGEVSVLLDVDFPESYHDLESVFLSNPENPSLVPYFIESINITNKKCIIKFEEVNSADEADMLQSWQLFLPLDNLPSLDDQQFYYHEVIGFQVIDKNLGPLGIIKQIYEVPGQDLLGMEYQKQEVLIPVQDEIIIYVNKEEKLLEVSLPDGLLEIYLK